MYSPQYAIIGHWTLTDCAQGILCVIPNGYLSLQRATGQQLQLGRGWSEGNALDAVLRLHHIDWTIVGAEEHLA